MQVAQQFALVFSARKFSATFATTGASRSRVAWLICCFMLPKTNNRNWNLTRWTFKSHYFSLWWLHFPWCSGLLYLLKHYCNKGMANRFTVMLTILILFMTYCLTRRTITKMAGMFVFFYMSTFIFKLAKETTFRSFSVFLSTTGNCYIGFFTTASYFGFPGTRIAWTVMAYCCALMTATLQGLVTDFLTRRTVSIATFTCTTMFSTRSYASALCFTFILLTTR